MLIMFVMVHRSKSGEMNVWPHANDLCDWISCRLLSRKKNSILTAGNDHQTTGVLVKRVGLTECLLFPSSWKRNANQQNDKGNNSKHGRHCHHLLVVAVVECYSSQNRVSVDIHTIIWIYDIRTKRVKKESEKADSQESCHFGMEWEDEDSPLIIHGRSHSSSLE